MSTRITVSELDRTMSDVLNRVAYQGESFTIERGGKDVARLEPVGPPREVTAQEVAERLGHLPIPEGLGDDLEAIKASIPKLEVPDWLK
jgi:antitoxin (DNA-binding transcriptional repressor) of toxin-antitoxin stability system